MRSKRTRPTPEQIAVLQRGISKDYASGMTTDELTEKYNVGKDKVRYALLRTCTPFRLPEGCTGKVQALKKAGWSYEKIADEYNSSAEIVRKFCIERGI